MAATRPETVLRFPVGPYSSLFPICLDRARGADDPVGSEKTREDISERKEYRETEAWASLRTEGARRTSVSALLLTGLIQTKVHARASEIRIRVRESLRLWCVRRAYA